MGIVSYLIILNILQLCVSINQIWHSYQYDPVHENREEFVITNITSEDEFKLEYFVTKWKSLCLEKMCFAAGLMEKSVVIASITLNPVRSVFSQQSYQIELQEKPIDIALFQHWNSSSRQLDVIAVMATEKPELLWYKVGEIEHELIWTWPTQKDISHINIFQIENKFKILMIAKYESEITGDLYEFELDHQPNFWLHQKIELSDQAASSTVINFGLNYYLAIPQKSLEMLLVYRLENNHFGLFKSLKSSGIDDIISFRTPHKCFLAFNGLNAGIYRFTQNDLIREKIVNSHLDSVNYWLPMSVTTSREEIVLIAQRSLDHGHHKSFVIEIITYNGDKFEEHEDIPCLYFGDNVLGLSCLPGVESGMSGAAPVTINGVLGLLIPRDKSCSEMFIVHTDIVKNKNPVHIQLENLLQQQQYLDNLIKEQEKRYQEIVARPRQVGASTMKTQLKEMNQNLDLMKDKLESKEYPVHYTTIVFNGMVEVKGEGKFEEIEVNTIKDETADEVLTDIVLRDNIIPIESQKTFEHLETDDLNFDKVNNISANDMVFATDSIILNNNLLLNKTLTIHQNATVEEINGKHFENEVVNLDSPTDELVFENIEIMGDIEVDTVNYSPLSLSSEEIRLDPTNMVLDSLWLPQNIIAKNVNNENFDQFLGQLCLRNIKTNVPGVIKVDGNIHVKENAEIDYLKGLKFPQEYVFKDNSFPNITGEKLFNKKLITSELNCEGTVDDIQTSKIITLSTDQAVTGTTIFKQLKVTESLNVGGKVLGEHANKFLPNPLLSESDLIKANVHFKDLEVEGDIILTEQFNGENFELLLSDIVYADEEEPVIVGMKQFPEGLTIRTNLLITSNSINDIDLNSVVTKDTDQFLNITTLHGIVNFGNVDVDGLYDTVDIRELDENIVKLEGEQYISSTLVFENDLNVNELEITETINHFSEDAFLPVNEQMANSNDIDSLRFLNVTVDGNIYGNIEGFSLEDFDNRRLSFTKDQVIEAHYNIIESFVERLEPVQINNMDFKDLGKESLLDNIRYKLRHKNLNITNLHISDSVQIVRINNKPTTNLGGSLWKNDDKICNLTFNGETHFESVQIEKLSSVNFTRFISVLVFKNETNPKISGRKIFLDGITVEKLIETEKLNNVTLSNILTKEGPQEILGPIIIHGNVTFGTNITLYENINEIPVTLITDNYQVNDNGYQIKGDILFNRLSYIYNLEIRGYVNDKFAQKTIDKIVYKGEDFKLEGHTIFENKVNIEGNIRVINKTNDIDLAGFASDMVLVTKDTDIKSPVKFKESVHVENRMTLVNDLKTRTLNGFDLHSWMENAIFIDKGQLEGNFILEDVEIVDHLYTNYINDINLNSLIPLRTQQNIKQLSFDQVTSLDDIIVGNSTNYHNLPDEFSNTVLTSSDQEIVSEVEFLGKVFIEGKMEIFGRLNDMEMSNIVTTNTDQNLNAIYNFKAQTILEKNLEVEGLVNGINMTIWMSEGIKTVSHLPQNITDNWHIEHDLIFENDTQGGGLINGLDLQTYRQEVEDKRNHKYTVEKGFIDDFLNICKDLTYMYNKLKKQIYKFIYLEKLQEMSFQHKLRHVYHFQKDTDFYLLVTEEKSCESHLFIFDLHFRFVKNIPFGLISQIISVKNNDLLYFVVRSEPVCEVQGTNLWQVGETQFVHLAVIEDQEVLQESIIPGTFYGISGHTVTEFKIALKSEFVVAKHRKWEVREENMAFVPRGLSTGLAIRTGKKLIRLNRDDPSFNDINYETETIIRGNFTEEFNTYLPGRKDGDLVVMKVGIKTNKRSLLAVASHEETSVKGSVDFIKIYEDAIEGKVFHKVPTYKPSSLVALEFDNGETLLTFMEDESVLQLYEYKGIEGFKHKLSVKLGGSKLFTMTMQINKLERRVLGLIDRNRISFMEAVMLGNQIEDGLQCSL